MKPVAELEPEEPFDLSDMEKLTIIRALRKCKGDKLQAARILGIGKTTLYRKISVYGLKPQPVVICPSCGCEIGPFQTSR